MNKKFLYGYSIAVTGLAATMTYYSLNYAYKFKWVLDKHNELAHKYNHVQDVREEQSRKYLETTLSILDWSDALYTVIQEQNPELLSDPRLEKPAIDLTILNMELQEEIEELKGKNS